MLRLVIALSVLVAAPVARAESSPPPTEEKSPEVAVLLSLGVTTAGLVTVLNADSENAMLVGLGALYFGPSTGQWYAGEAGLVGLGLRGLGGAAVVYGFATVLGSECDSEDGPCDDDDGDVGGALMLAGAGLWIGSTVADIVFAKQAADRWNKERALSLAPAQFPAAGGGRATGLVLSGRF